MNPSRVPAALRERLGEPASAELVEMVDSGIEAAIVRAGERFERRLKEELGALRLELRTDIANLRAELRTEMGVQGAQLRTEMGALAATLRTEMADLRADLLKWSFLFWTGQIVTIAALLALMHEALACSRPLTLAPSA